MQIGQYVSYIYQLKIHGNTSSSKLWFITKIDEIGLDHALGSMYLIK